MRLSICIESIILVGICMADMFSTLYFVLSGAATEQNPLMAACINTSPLLFVLVKLASFVPFIIAVEMYRRKNPAFARSACRMAIFLYVAAFAALTLKINLV